MGSLLFWRESKESQAGGMEIGSIPRHTRRGFIERILPSNLATALANPDLAGTEIMDFSAPRQKSESERQIADALMNYLARTLEQEHDNHEMDFSPSGEFEASASGFHERNPNIVEDLRSSAATLRKPIPTTLRRMKARLEMTSDGQRQELFENGCRIRKDAVGRVIEVYAISGECLFLSYDDRNELCKFTRMNADGSLHSTGSKSRNSVTVRDRDGRVKAIGECMTVDPWGRFYLHAKDGQYFSLDLVAGIHSERRRIIKEDGSIDFVSAAFAQDGFRMATSYARSLSNNHNRRVMSYRFYGRDGTFVEFRTEEEFRELYPTRSLPPGTLPVDPSWLNHRQAHTAWESVQEYLCRVS